MFTSQYPARHRVLRNGHKLRAAVPTLAGLLSEQGFDTAGVVAMGFLATLKNGFGSFDKKKKQPYRPADEVVDRALSWASDRDPSRRFFLWVHFYDVHNSGSGSASPSRTSPVCRRIRRPGSTN